MPSPCRTTTSSSSARAQRVDGGRGHGPGRAARAVSREEPFHRRHGLDHRAHPGLPLRARWVDRVPDPQRVFEDLELGSCPIHEPEVQSASIAQGGGDQSPDPALLRPRESCWSTWARRWVSTRCSGMAEVAAGRGAGEGHRSLLRAPAPDRWTRCGPRDERGRARGVVHRHVRQRDGRDRPLPARPREACAGAQHAQLPRRQLDLRGPVPTGQRAVPRLRLASPGDAHHVEGARWPWDHRRRSAVTVRTLRGRAARRHQAAASWSTTASCAASSWARARR